MKFDPRTNNEGKTYQRTDKGAYIYSDWIKYHPKGLAVAVGEFTIWPGRGAPHWINEQNSAGINSENTQQGQLAIRDYLAPKVYNRPILDIASEKRLREIKTNIDMYVESSREMFIKGKFSFSQWDTYCNNLNKLGLKEMEALFQRAYDSLNQ